MDNYPYHKAFWVKSKKSSETHNFISIMKKFETLLKEKMHQEEAAQINVNCEVQFEIPYHGDLDELERLFKVLVVSLTGAVPEKDANQLKVIMNQMDEYISDTAQKVFMSKCQDTTNTIEKAQSVIDLTDECTFGVDSKLVAKYFWASSNTAKVLKEIMKIVGTYCAIENSKNVHENSVFYLVTVFQKTLEFLDKKWLMYYINSFMPKEGKVKRRYFSTHLKTVIRPILESIIPVIMLLYMKKKAQNFGPTIEKQTCKKMFFEGLEMNVLHLSFYDCQLERVGESYSAVLRYDISRELWSFLHRVIIFVARGEYCEYLEHPIDTGDISRYEHLDVLSSCEEVINEGRQSNDLFARIYYDDTVDGLKRPNGRKIRKALMNGGIHNIDKGKQKIKLKEILGPYLVENFPILINKAMDDAIQRAKQNENESDSDKVSTSETVQTKRRQGRKRTASAQFKKPVKRRKNSNEDCFSDGGSTVHSCKVESEGAGCGDNDGSDTFISKNDDNVEIKNDYESSDSGRGDSVEETGNHPGVTLDEHIKHFEDIFKDYVTDNDVSTLKRKVISKMRNDFTDITCKECKQIVSAYRKGTCCIREKLFSHSIEDFGMQLNDISIYRKCITEGVQKYVSEKTDGRGSPISNFIALFVSIITTIRYLGFEDFISPYTLPSHLRCQNIGEAGHIPKTAPCLFSSRYQSELNRILSHCKLSSPSFTFLKNWSIIEDCFKKQQMCSCAEASVLPKSLIPRYDSSWKEKNADILEALASLVKFKNAGDDCVLHRIIWVYVESMFFRSSCSAALMMVDYIRILAFRIVGLGLDYVNSWHVQPYYLY